MRAYFEPRRNVEDIVSGVSYCFFAFHTAVAYYVPSIPQRLFSVEKQQFLESGKIQQNAATTPHTPFIDSSITQTQKTPAFLQHFYIITYLFIQQCSMTYIFPTTQRDGHRLHESSLYTIAMILNSIAIHYKCIFTKVT